MVVFDGHECGSHICSTIPDEAVKFLQESIADHELHKKIDDIIKEE